jgi:[ribosomal protein S18]-alanine N-acetyltransferase
VKRKRERASAAIKLRRGRRSDLDALDALERDIFKSRLFSGHLISRPSFRRLLASPTAAVIVAELGGQLSGQLIGQLSGYVLVLYRSNSAFARMYSIGVGTDFRRRGLARLLLTAAERDALRRDRTGMKLEVRADDRAAIALYETAGYRYFGRSPGYYGGRVDALRFAKALPKDLGRRS